MRSVRTLTFGLIALAITYIVATTVKVPSVVFLLHHAAFGGFLPLAFATAAGITNDKAVLVGTVALVLIVAISEPIGELANALWPIGLGVLVGTLIGKGIREAKERGDGEPVQREGERRD